MAPLVEDRLDPGREWASVMPDAAVLPRGFKGPELPSGYTWHPAPEDVRPNLPPAGELVFFSDQFKYGLSLPLSEEVKSICRELQIIPTMITPNGYSVVNGMSAVFKAAQVPWRVDTFMWFMSVRVLKGGACYFTPRKRGLIHTEDLPSSLSGWKKQYFCVRPPPGEWWGFDLTPGMFPEKLYASTEEPAGARAVTEWIGARMCVMHLAQPFQPELSFKEREVKSSAPAEEGAEAEASKKKKKKKAVASREPKQKKQKIAFLEYVPVEGTSGAASAEGGSQALPLSELVKAAAASPPREEASGGQEVEVMEVAATSGGEVAGKAPQTPGGAADDRPFVEWLDDGTRAILGPIPRRDGYGAEASGNKAFEALQVISSAGDWARYEGCSIKRLSHMVSNHVINAGQIALYLGSVAGSSTRQVRDLEATAVKREALLKKKAAEAAQASAEGSNARALLEQAEEVCAQKDAEIARLRAEVEKAQAATKAKHTEITELRIAGAAEKGRVDSLRDKVEGLEAEVKDLKRDLAAVPSTESLLESYRQSQAHADDMLLVSEGSFDITRDYFVAHGMASEDKVSKVVYADVEEWFLATSIPPPP